MQIIDISKQETGTVFPEPLFHASGRKLLSANTVLTREHLDALLRSGNSQVFMAGNAREVLEFAKTPQVIVESRRLVVGAVAEADLLTPDGVLMIHHNEPIEDHHVAALHDSGIDYLIQRPQANVDTVRLALQDLSRVVVNRMEQQIKRGEYLRAPESRDPLKNAIPKPTNEILAINAVNLLRRRLSSRLQPVFGLLETGKSASVEILEDITTDLLDLMKSEPRQFSQLALMTARREDHLPDHALSVAVLAMAMATQLGLSNEHVKEVVIGALLFDVGMLWIPKRIRVGSGVLSEADRQRVREHPILSVSMMEQIPSLSAIPRLIGYQHHERLNGTGYPAAASQGNVSDYARIITVADIYAASTNPRTYKTQKLPYTAMEELVHMAHRGQVDVKMVKALLAAVGLFPVGSYVALSNGTTGQVVGANSAKIDRPLVVPVERGGVMSSTLLDLSSSQCDHLKIMKAIPMPQSMAEKLSAGA
jgi:HD-GYP domain-containing protein (c-di-GMP phosphodiesterase class II)